MKEPATDETLSTNSAASCGIYRRHPRDLGFIRHANQRPGGVKQAWDQQREEDHHAGQAQVQGGRPT